MTITRSATSPTTPRSCEMNTMAVSNSRWISRNRPSTSAWMVTSSAVVGSSAISTLGSHIIAMAIMTRWRIPPENSCG
ncbi:hypothetical protein BVK87_00170 [Achromobacter denitrificans]|nr:hypothetical protein BVK87_00170 [Achromobacter denitrificans]